MKSLPGSYRCVFSAPDNLVHIGMVSLGSHCKFLLTWSRDKKIFLELSSKTSHIWSTVSWQEAESCGQTGQETIFSANSKQ